MLEHVAHPNAMGEAVKGGYGGGIPVAAFWTGSVGEAIGHVETIPWTLSIPVKVDPDGKVRSVSVSIPINQALSPGESYATPRSFLSIFSGDFYEPLRLWSSVLQKKAGRFRSPTNTNIGARQLGIDLNIPHPNKIFSIPN